ncbi:hypothetical protein [Pseudoalteromonas tunicata]|uniref:Uncharacterized protein n=1 Tax=Pseudoalteromonas tunicata D2 TaxID=87626 RepID=A4C683_9GAMM|nr:hypothetical protein [Pseudoalteromonas tunicata]ATC95461.1 hypothetical protein PTUN_a3073 [Pseudoalteromonas tunicata]AXT31037.1 hypothetical protein D1819_09675 [Pseudoalteromonas tunicata]EAR29487.1 hypothetical protein PTD2_11744 [Pseudoalteromonas tunicata D2]MDP4985686.1 hypothetical protein [Pseudoalteromonas tunicata]MDP5212391.1 hypothetical protein [Pseudoalteromonas tunicata]
MSLKLSQYIKQQLGKEWSMSKVEAYTQGALSKRTANNWYHGEKRALLELLVEGIKHQQMSQLHNETTELSQLK